MCTADGRYLNKDFYQTKLHTVIRNDDKWPEKHHIASGDFTVWRKFLRLVFATPSYSLQVPLGQWLHSVSPLHHVWDWFLSSSKEFVYHYDNNCWKRYLQVPHHHRSYYSTPLIMDSVPSDTLHRATIKLTECANGPFCKGDCFGTYFHS